MANLEITALDAWALREPGSRRSYTVMRLTTKSGLMGYGECGDVPAREIEAARRVVIGRSATSYQAVRVALPGAPRVLAGIDVAMLDLIGKSTKMPVFQILGGPTRNRARALGSLRGVADEELIASARSLQGVGYRAFAVPLPPVVRCNLGQAFVQAVKRRLDAVRAAADGVDLVLDGAASLTPRDAGRLAAALESFHLLWFDEPCRISSLIAVRKISDKSATPLGFGRNMGQPGEALEALRAEIIDILRPDLARHGISQIRRMAALAETYYIAVAPYHDGGPIGTAAALHLAASLPNFFIQHIPVPEAEADRRMRAELAGGSVEVVKDGFSALPTGPGLGITVSDDALEEYKERLL